MSIEFEDQLRAEMGRVRVTPRPGLAREAHRRYARSRRRTALAVAATGTAAAVAGATAGYALTARTPASAPAETTASVVDQVTSALSATDAIGYSTARFSGPGAAIGFLNDRTAEWEFGELSRQLIETAAGRPLVDRSTRPQGRDLRVTIVGYASRDWTVAVLPHGQLDQPPLGDDDLCNGSVLGLFNTRFTSAADWKKIIANGLRCGAFTEAGRQWVDGVDAIRLIGHEAASHTTIWVDPGTYLPVRLTDDVRVIFGSTKDDRAATLTIDFRWLPPTKANLRELTAPIPPGFHFYQAAKPAPPAVSVGVTG
jgi:hypothetical protein